MLRCRSAQGVFCVLWCVSVNEYMKESQVFNKHGCVFVLLFLYVLLRHLTLEGGRLLTQTIPISEGETTFHKDQPSERKRTSVYVINNYILSLTLLPCSIYAISKCLMKHHFF